MSILLSGTADEWLVLGIEEEEELSAQVPEGDEEMEEDEQEQAAQVNEEQSYDGENDAKVEGRESERNATANTTVPGTLSSLPVSTADHDGQLRILG